MVSSASASYGYRFDAETSTLVVQEDEAKVVRLQRDDLQRTRSHDVFVQPINYAIEHLHERDPEVESFASEFMTGTIDHADRSHGYLAMAAKLNRLSHRVRQEIGARILEMESKAKPDAAPWSLYIFAADGTLQKVWPNVNPAGHAEEVLAALREHE